LRRSAKAWPLRKGLSSGQVLAKVAAHAVAGGTLTDLQGGKFGHGFISAGFTEALSPAVGQMEGNGFGAVLSRTAASAAIGGTASKLAGGSFANGAATSAFQELFNRTSHAIKNKKTRGPDLNLDPPGSSEFNSDNRMSNDPDVFELAAHGNSQGIEDARTEARPQIGSKQIASLIESHTAWREGMTVKLFACSTGAGVNPVAKKLAIRLNTLVIAPTTDVQVWLLGGYHFNRAQLNAGGRWKVFSPRVESIPVQKPILSPILKIGN
jgi:hypothetical protein